MTNTRKIHVLNRDQLRVLANPLRQRILNLLCSREMSTTGLRREFVDAPSNLYHHVHKLVDAGLLRQVRSEPRRGAVERYYRAVASGFTVPPELLALGAGGAQPEVVATLRTMLEETLGKLSESLLRDVGGAGVDAEMPMISAFEVRVGRQRIAELRARVDALVQEMLDDAGAAEDAQEHAFLVMFFPLAGKDADAGQR